MALVLVETPPKSVARSHTKNDDEEEEQERRKQLLGPVKENTSITNLPAALVSEILHRLDAKGLSVVSCVSTLLNALATENQGWRQFYHDRWGPPLPASRAPPASSAASWKDLFLEREGMSRAFMGRYTVDALRGHTDAVRSVFLLSPAGLAFTGGYDSVVRAWDVDKGLSVAASRPLGCTIRAITADMELLVAGGTDAFLQCWKAVPGHPHVFDITGHGGAGSEFRLLGHGGPVACLAVDPTRIYSGSWDMSVRIWDRTSLKCLHTLQHGDWVWSLVPCGATFASTAGRDVYVWDVSSGNLMKVIEDAHTGNTVSLARNYSGDLLFSGGEDGAIHMFEVVNQDDGEDVKPVATWMPHSSAVNSLAFEFPWLVSCSSDGRLALIDIRKLLRLNGKSIPKSHFGDEQSTGAIVEAPQRMLHGTGCNLFSVSIGADRIVCGGEDGSVRVWNFSRALEVEKKVQAARRVRMENRMRRRMNQIEMNNKAGRSDQCSVAAKRNQMNGDRAGVWHSKRGLREKLKA